MLIFRAIPCDGILLPDDPERVGVIDRHSPDRDKGQLNPTDRKSDQCLGGEGLPIASGDDCIRARSACEGEFRGGRAFASKLLESNRGCHRCCYPAFATDAGVFYVDFAEPKIMADRNSLSQFTEVNTQKRRFTIDPAIRHRKVCARSTKGAANATKRDVRKSVCRQTFICSTKERSLFIC
jgi:hypothetical protein